MPFWYAHSSIFLNTSWIRRILCISSVALVVSSPSSTYPQILSPVFLLFPWKILKNGIINSINNISKTGDPYKTPIWIGSWFPVCPSNFILVDYSAKNKSTQQIKGNRILCLYNHWISYYSITLLKAPLISNASIVRMYFLLKVFLYHMLKL